MKVTHESFTHESYTWKLHMKVLHMKVTHESYTWKFYTWKLHMKVTHESFTHESYTWKLHMKVTHERYTRKLHMKEIKKILAKTHFKCKYKNLLMLRNSTFSWKHVSLQLSFMPILLPHICRGSIPLLLPHVLRGRSHLPVICECGITMSSMIHLWIWSGLITHSKNRATWLLSLLT